MKNITTNKLQSELSKTIKEVESGEEYTVNRYSEPVAFLISKERYEELVNSGGCKECIGDLRKIAKGFPKSKMDHEIN